ncbi:MAG: flagellar biosynthetic protein FliR [Lachnospiraceae bacterium]|nr:flagellar biosynthetic protein FliR [Lachnospiraceae bacterium]
MNVDFSVSLKELEYFLLILIRVGSFVGVAPFFNTNNTPRPLKIWFSVFVSFLLYEVISPHVYVTYSTMIEYTICILKELITGLLIGFSANVAVMVTTFAGQLVDNNIGFSMAAQMDPITQQNTTVSGYVYRYGFMLVFIVSGMYRYLIEALAETFELIPVNGAVFNLELMFGSFIELITQYVMLGFWIALPVFSVILILNGLLGVMAKVSPQMNMFSVGIQIKAIVGLTVMWATISLLPKAGDLIYKGMQRSIVSVIKAMGGGV